MDDLLSVIETIKAEEEPDEDGNIEWAFVRATSTNSTSSSSSSSNGTGTTLTLRELIERRWSGVRQYLHFGMKALHSEPMDDSLRLGGHQTVGEGGHVNPLDVESDGGVYQLRMVTHCESEGFSLNRAAGFNFDPRVYANDTDRDGFGWTGRDYLGYRYAVSVCLFNWCSPSND